MKKNQDNQDYSSFNPSSENHPRVYDNRVFSKDSVQVVLYQPNETLSLQVRLDTDQDTVWLTQQQIAELFGTKRPAITKHLGNIFKTGELNQKSVSSILEHTAADGKTYNVQYYNLDAIISVGYRVNSLNATAFRRWATSVLKEHLLKGYSINSQLIALQERTDERITDLQQQLNEQKDKVEFLVQIHHKDSDRLFPTGCVFDAWEHISALIRTATQSIILIDNYCDERTLSILSKRSDTIPCTIYTRYTESFKQDLDKHNRQYAAIEFMQLSQKEHDRFLIIDNTVYILGDSLKDLGHSLTTVLKTTFTPQSILSLI